MQNQVVRSRKHPAVATLLLLFIIAYIALHAFLPLAIFGVLGAGLGISSVLLSIGAIALGAIFIFSIFSTGIGIAATIVFGIVFLVASLAILPILIAAAPLLLIAMLFMLLFR